MTFKEFSAWCNERVCNGRWGMFNAMECIAVITEINKNRKWKREKTWQQHKSREYFEMLVDAINEKIEGVASDE